MSNKIKKIKVKNLEGIAEEYTFTFEPTEFLDVFYPVGTIYETLDTNFNPNESWGGMV